MWQWSPLCRRQESLTIRSWVLKTVQGFLWGLCINDLLNRRFQSDNEGCSASSEHAFHSREREVCYCTLCCWKFLLQASMEWTDGECWWSQDPTCLYHECNLKKVISILSWPSSKENELIMAGFTILHFISKHNADGTQERLAGRKPCNRNDGWRSEHYKNKRAKHFSFCTESGPPL